MLATFRGIDMQREANLDEAMARGLPIPLAVAIIRDGAGRYNPITLAWVMNTSKNPPMLAIAIGRERYSSEALAASRQFVVAWPSATMAHETLVFGTRSGRDIDKLGLCGSAVQPALRIDSLLLSDAVANFECELASTVETGDHLIHVGRIVAAHVHQDPNVRRLYALATERMGAVAPDCEPAAEQEIHI